MVARWLKRIGLTLVVLAIVVVGALGAALLLVDTEALKSRIEGRVLAETGRELNIEGPLEISVLPWVGFELGPTRLANAPGFGDRPFVALEHAELRVRVLPLLQREIVLDTIVLHGARVNAARNAQGRTNWADLVERQEAGAGETAPEADPPTAEEPAQAEEESGLRFRVEGVDLRDARLTWRDAQNDREIVLDDLDLSTGALAPDRPAQIQLSATLRANNALAVAIETRARVHYDLASQAGSVQGLTIDLAAQGPGLPPGTTASLGADIRFDLAEGSATVDPLTLTAMDTLTGEGAVHTRFGGDTPSFTGEFAIAPFSPTELIEAVHGTLPERADSSTLQRADLAVSFRGSPDEITVEPLEASLDDTLISGRAHARFAPTPDLQLGLNVYAIDLDRYLPPTEEESDGGESAPGAGQDAGEPAASDPIADLPTQALQGLRARAQLSVGQLQWRGLAMNELQLDANLADGVLDVTRADMGVAEGRIRASGQLDARDAQSPAARVDAELADLQSGPLLAAFLDDPLITGRLNAQAQLSAAGPTLDDWTRSLNGNLATIFRDGAIRGMNIPQRLRVAAARLSGDELTQASETRRTDFSSLSISAAIAEGVARSDDLDLRAPLVRAGGEGWVNLPERTLDYTARIVITGTLEGQDGGSGPDLRGAEVPLRLSGPLDAPEIELAVAESLRDRLQQEVEQESEEVEQRAREEIEEEVDKARDRIEEELREGLDGLFE